MSRRRFVTEDKAFSVVVAFWIISAVLTLAFWGGVGYVVYRILAHFGIL